MSPSGSAECRNPNDEGMTNVPMTNAQNPLFCCVRELLESDLDIRHWVIRHSFVIRVSTLDILIHDPSSFAKELSMYTEQLSQGLSIAADPVHPASIAVGTADTGGVDMQ